VFGIIDGFSHLMAGDTTQVTRLTPADVAFIHSEGGSILRTSRANPTRNPDHRKNVVDALQRLGITRLASIGGEDTALVDVADVAGQRKTVPLDHPWILAARDTGLCLGAPLD